MRNTWVRYGTYRQTDRQTCRYVEGRGWINERRERERDAHGTPLLDPATGARTISLSTGMSTTLRYTPCHIHTHIQYNNNVLLAYNIQLLYVQVSIPYCTLWVFICIQLIVYTPCMTRGWTTPLSHSYSCHLTYYTTKHTLSIHFLICLTTTTRCNIRSTVCTSIGNLLGST